MGGSSFLSPPKGSGTEVEGVCAFLRVRSSPVWLPSFPKNSEKETLYSFGRECLSWPPLPSALALSSSLRFINSIRNSNIFSSPAAPHPAVLFTVPCSFTPTSSSNPGLLMTPLHSSKRARSFCSTCSRSWGRRNESWAALGRGAHSVGKAANEDWVNNTLPLEWVGANSAVRGAASSAVSRVPGGDLHFGVLSSTQCNSLKCYYFFS